MNFTVYNSYQTCQFLVHTVPITAFNTGLSLMLPSSGWSRWMVMYVFTYLSKDAL